MRKTYHTILKECFYNNLIQTRTSLGLMQSDMAQRLAVDDRPYIDLDHGKTCCSATTLALYLLYVCEDTYGFLESCAKPLKLEPVWRCNVPVSRRILEKAASYRIPRPVTEALLFSSGDSFPLCPRCGISLEREYMAFCNNCGQRLAWNRFSSATVCHAPRKKSKNK